MLTRIYRPRYANPQGRVQRVHEPPAEYSDIFVPRNSAAAFHRVTCMILHHQAQSFRVIVQWWKINPSDETKSSPAPIHPTAHTAPLHFQADTTTAQRFLSTRVLYKFVNFYK